MFAKVSFADEQLFGYIQSAETIPQGGKQLYQWVTHRAGRSQGSFNAQDYRTEFEYGITDRLQGSLYVNARSFLKILPQLKMEVQRIRIVMIISG